MWFFSRQKTEQRANIENPSVPISSASIVSLLGLNSISEAGIAVNRENAMECTPVWAAVSFVSQSLASLPLKVYEKKEGSREVVSDPISRILHDAPNPETTSFDWRKMVATDLLMSGRHISYIARNRRGGVASIWPLERSKVTIERIGGKKTYTYKENGKSSVYRADQVIDLVRMYERDNLIEIDPISH